MDRALRSVRLSRRWPRSRADDLLAGYPVSEGVFDEAFAADGAPRPHARAGLEAVARADAGRPAGPRRALAAARRRALLVGRGRPRVLRRPRPARDHRRRLGAGQARARPARARAERVRRRRLRRPADRRRGRRPARGRSRPPTTTSPRCAACEPPSGVWIGVAGLDLVRDAQRRVARARGQRPHAERLRLPARHAARAARAHRRAARTRRRARSTARSTCWPTRCAPPRPRAPAAAARRMAAVLTDGEHNSAYWEHAWLSRQLGIPLVEPHELEVARRRAVAAARAGCASRAASTSSTAARTPTGWTPTSAAC